MSSILQASTDTRFHLDPFWIFFQNKTQELAVCQPNQPKDHRNKPAIWQNQVYWPIAMRKTIHQRNLDHLTKQRKRVKEWSLGETETQRCCSRLRAKQRCLCIKATSLGLDCKVHQWSSFQKVQRQMWMLCPETPYMKLCMYLGYKSRLLLYDKMT